MMRTPSVLVIDDDETEVFFLTNAVKKTGARMECTHAADGTAGLEKLKATPADIVLLDINMPGMSGHDVLGRLREYSKRQPVIMFSSSSNPDDVMMSYDKGANAYVVKPSSPDEYRTLVETIEAFWFNLAKVPNQITNDN